MSIRKPPPRRATGTWLVRVPLAGVAVVALTVMTACGAGAGGESENRGDTHTVTDTFLGDVPDVPVHPKHILALWHTGPELAELGIVPVAALEDEFLESELGADLYERVKDVPTVGTYAGVDVEKVIEADPDLIVGMDSGSLGIDYDQFADIIPTVIFEVAEPTDVWDNFPKLAEVVGQGDGFAQRQAEVDQGLAEIAAEHGDILGDAEAVAIEVLEGTIYVDTSKSLNWRRLDAAGFGYLDEYTDNPDRYATELSPENLPSLNDADIIFYASDIDGTPTAGTQDILDMESFTRLPAAQAGNVFPLTSGVIYTFAAANAEIEDLRAAADAYQPAGP